MKIGGLEFPYDHQRDVRVHGRFVGIVLRIHPLALWLPAIVLGLILGILRK
jgi:hypothetical protein